MTKRLTSLILAILLGISSIMTLSASAAPSTNYNTEKNYNEVYDGVVDGANTATISNVRKWLIFYDYTRITPNPTAAPDQVIKIDHYGLDSSLNISARSLEYISIYCQYTGTKTLENPMITVMGANGNITLSSDESIPKDSYGWVNFDVGYAARGTLTDDALAQFHLMPYGNTASGILSDRKAHV